jgi:hypothetical protein
LGLVFWTSKENRGLQSANLLASPECLRKSLALYPNGCHTQSLLCDSRGTIFLLNFNFPEHPKSSVSGPRFVISFSVICNVALFMQCYITRTLRDDSPNLKIRSGEEKLYFPLACDAIGGQE